MQEKTYDVGNLLEPSPNTLHLLIVKQFRQMIQDGLFQEGDRLPSERELAAMLGVSRIPIRESLKILEFLGIIRRNRGREMTLGHLDLSQVLDFFDFQLRNPLQTVEELFETREALECQSAMLAARRHTAADLEILEDAVRAMEEAMHGDGKMVEPNVNFHSLIVAATHNRVLKRVYESMFDLSTFSRREILADPERRRTELDNHKTILKRIAARDEEGAALAMREHMRSALEYLRKKDRTRRNSAEHSKSGT